jgi:ABC-type uncharacterized transport system ATPase subunit
MNQIAIRASALTRQFSSVRALNDLTIEVPAGVVFGFLGPNGAGKTTAIRLLLNLIEPTGGSAEVLGIDTRTHGHEIRSRCGALLEHSGLYERLSAEDMRTFIPRNTRAISHSVGKPASLPVESDLSPFSCSAVLEAAAHEKKTEETKGGAAENKIGSPGS